MTPPTYKPIEPLSPDFEPNGTALPTRLNRIWQRDRDILFSDNARKQFYERWSMELGLVENVFRWDRGITLMLIDQNLDPSVLINKAGERAEDAERSISAIRTHIATLEDVEIGFINEQTQLTANFIRQIHEQLLVHQDTHDVFVPGEGFVKHPLPKGEYKKTRNDPRGSNPPHDVVKSYCPPEETAAEVLRLCDFFHSDVIQEAPPSVRAAWLHHRFTQIHPFVDGNGRVARTLATLVLLKAELLPLTIRRDEDRSRYLDALEQADDGDLHSLVVLFNDRIRSDVLTLIDEAGDEKSALDQAMEALTGRLSLRMERATQLMPQIAAGAQNRFNSQAQDIVAVLNQGHLSSERFKIESPIIAMPDKKDHRHDVNVLRTPLNYHAEVNEISAFIQFSIVTEYKFSIVLHLHERAATDGGGFAVLGLMIEESDDGSAVEVIPVGTDPLLISVDTAVSTLQNSLVQWAAKTVSAAIKYWGRSQ